MKTVPALVSHPARSLRKNRSVRVHAWRPVCVIKVMSSVLASVCLLKHVVALMRAATISQASSSGQMRLAVVNACVTQLWAW